MAASCSPSAVLSALVGGEGYWDRPTPQRDLWGSVGSGLNHPGGQGTPLFGAALQARSKSTIGTPGTDYEGGMDVYARVHIDIIPLSWAPERNEQYDPPTGWAHKIRDIDNPKLGLHPPPEVMDPGGEI